jgi:hypothetical protein
MHAERQSQKHCTHGNGKQLRSAVKNAMSADRVNIGDKLELMWKMDRAFFPASISNPTTRIEQCSMEHGYIGGF